MATAIDIVEKATAEVGYYAPTDPEVGSKYGRWMSDLTGEEWLQGSSTSVWWCNMFVSWVLAQCRQECPGYPSYNTDVTLSANPALVYREDVKPGDIIIWDWDGNGATDHVGIVSYHVPGEFGYLQTIEGNYHNSVAVVDRSNMWECVAACIRPPYDAEDSSPSEVEEPETPEDYVTDYAYMTINGDFGNGKERIDAIYLKVQNRVNEILKGAKAEDCATDNFALAVINGDYGNGDDRRYNMYCAVQNRVNELLS